MSYFKHFFFGLLVALLSWGTIISLVAFFSSCLTILLNQEYCNENSKIDKDDKDEINIRKWLTLSCIYLFFLILILWTSKLHLYDVFGMNIEVFE
jgi:hypothetical protein